MYLVGILMVAVPASNNNPPNARINLQGPFGRGGFISLNVSRLNYLKNISQGSIVIPDASVSFTCIL